MNVTKWMFSLSEVSKIQILTSIRELIILSNEWFVFFFGNWLNSSEIRQVKEIIPNVQEDHTSSKSTKLHPTKSSTVRFSLYS